MRIRDWSSDVCSSDLGRFGGRAYFRAMPQPPLRAAIVPVTPLQQNCTLLWCTETMKGAFVDPGGDLPKLKAAAAHHGVTVEKILLTHGHIDHCGEAKRSEEHTSELQSLMRIS